MAAPNADQAKLSTSIRCAAIAQEFEEGRTILMPNMKEVGRILRVMGTLNRTDSEIAATAYAAWNDFLCDGIQPSV